MSQRRTRHAPSQDDAIHEPPNAPTHTFTIRFDVPDPEVIATWIPEHARDELPADRRGNWEHDDLTSFGGYERNEYRNLTTLICDGGALDNHYADLAKRRPKLLSEREIERRIKQFVPHDGRRRFRQTDGTVTVRVADPLGAKGGRSHPLADEQGYMTDIRTMLLEALAFVLFGHYPPAPREINPPPRPAFRTARGVLAASRSGGVLGVGCQGLDDVALDRRRTNSHWIGELKVRGTTHSSTGRVANLAGVERAVDADLGVRGAKLDPLDEQLLRWQAEGYDAVEICDRFRNNIAVQRGIRKYAVAARVRPTPASLVALGWTDWEVAQEMGRHDALDAADARLEAEQKTIMNAILEEWSDRAIRHRITLARRRLEASLRHVPAPAIALAKELGDDHFSQPLIPIAPPKNRKRPQTEPSRPIVATLPSEAWL